MGSQAVVVEDKVMTLRARFATLSAGSRLYGWAVLAGMILPVVVMLVLNAPELSYWPTHDDPDPAVRADAIRRNGVRESSMRDDNVDVRMLAAIRGCDAAQLRPLLSDENSRVRTQATQTLGGINNLRAIRFALEDAHPLVRAHAVRSIAFSYPVKVPVDDKRRHAIRVFEELGGSLKQLAANDPDADVREAAKDALITIDKYTKAGN